MGRQKFQVCEADIQSVSDFLRCVEQYKDREDTAGNHSDLIFRGQSVDMPLLPKIARPSTRLNGALLRLEQLILEEFARSTPGFSRINVELDKWDRLAVAQHHGLPTRLLDWTFGALLALWVAVKDGPQPEHEHGVVWVLRTVPEDFINFGDEVLPHKGTANALTPFNLPHTRIFRPRLIAERIAAQRGIFTVHKARKTSKSPFLPLERNSAFTGRLVKIPIPNKRFEGLRKQLDLCGINEATVFPDLDGLCGHLAWRFTKRSLWRERL